MFIEDHVTTSHSVWRIDWIDPLGGRACLDACAACARLGDAEALKSWAKRAQRHYADALGSCSHGPQNLNEAVISILIYFDPLSLLPILIPISLSGCIRVQQPRVQ